jgi:UDP-2,3-diacylglucosamine pyrophosphatase LpxH
VRTLVISDLHLGSRHRRDVLRRPEVLAVLLEALQDVDRLVLLGDVVELQEGRRRAALAVAEPVLRAIARALPAGAEIVLVAGNHDDALVLSWLRRHSGPRAVDGAIPSDATPTLAQVTSWLAPVPVTVRYPGVWLTERIWATHGHYLDRHLVPSSAFGAARGRLRRPASGRTTPVAYERRSHRAATRLERVVTRRLPRGVSGLLDLVVRLLRSGTLPGPSERPVGHHLAPVLWRLLDFQMRHAALPALGRVAERLGVTAEWVVFGHAHRGGPRAGDDRELWRGPPDGPRLVNTGSWVYEPLLLHGASAGHPYWPGTAVLIEDDGEPRMIALVTELDGQA